VDGGGAKATAVLEWSAQDYDNYINLVDDDKRASCGSNGGRSGDSKSVGPSGTIKEVEEDRLTTLVPLAAPLYLEIWGWVTYLNPEVFQHEKLVFFRLVKLVKRYLIN
jgi:hypothetical protein